MDLKWCDKCEAMLHPKHCCEYISIGFTGIERFKYLRYHNSSEKSYRHDNISEHRKEMGTDKVMKERTGVDVDRIS